LGTVSSAANHHDSPLLPETLEHVEGGASCSTGRGCI
jgi:hypothetical protein